jgi:2-polyprenyl-6-methoxyphenol hydroxylase-like FAD-dependent oxidoreductase
MQGFSSSGSDMNHPLQAQVLIVGAGPVGLTLAMDLAQRGLDVLIVEKRPRGERPEAKCNHVSARSMEIFRRLGLASVLRGTGLPEDYPNDVAYRTTFTGDELSRIPIPCRKNRYTATGGPDTWWPTPEPPHRINQIYLEPVLFAHAESMSGIRILTQTCLEEFSQDDEGVSAGALDLSTGERLQIRCDYLVGCDGGRSAVRKAIGATLQGVEVVQRVQSTFLRAPDLLNRSKHPPAWATFSYNARRSGNVYAIDGIETFVVHNYLKPEETEFESVDRDWAIRTILGVGSEFQYEILSKEDWIGRRLVADKLQDRRVFICGDAAHLWVPMAGYGMNAGIADAMNLSWLLAGCLHGWAAKGALAAYEAERLPITEQVSRFAMNHSIALQKEREGVPGGIEAPGPAGEALRVAAGKVLYDLNVKQYCCAGLNFGYFYDASPLIAYDGESPPGYTMDQFTPSTVPGCRTPHVWLEDGSSLYDAFGSGFTLIRMDPDADARPLLEAAKQRGMPLTVLDVKHSEAIGLYRHIFVLARPDQHVAWRGDSLPQDPLALVDLVRGAAILAT